MAGILQRVLFLLGAGVLAHCCGAAEPKSASIAGWRELNYLPFSIKVPAGMTNMPAGVGDAFVGRVNNDRLLLNFNLEFGPTSLASYAIASPASVQNREFTRTQIDGYSAEWETFQGLDGGGAGSLGFTNVTRAMLFAVPYILSPPGYVSTNTRLYLQVAYPSMDDAPVARAIIESVHFRPPPPHNPVHDVAIAVLKGVGGRVQRVRPDPERADWWEGPIVEVSFQRAEATDAVLGALRDFTELRKLNLGLTRVTDAGMVNLSHLGLLEHLDLSGTVVTDKGLEVLNALPRLQSLSIARAAITGPGFAHAKDLPDLREISAPNGGITDAGMAGFKDLKHLRVLALSRNRIGDAGIAQLRGLWELEELRIAGTGITDAGLKSLEGLKRLKVLDLTNTRVTATGIGALEKAVPGLKIIR